MSKKSASNTVKWLGKVTLSQVQEHNKADGAAWVNAVSNVTSSIKREFPNVDGIQVAGAKAHQSSDVATHSSVLSAKFYAGKKKILSGHIHKDGTIDYGKVRPKSQEESGPSSSKSDSAWTPTRDCVDLDSWTIYDPDKRKTREVRSEDEWWYIETKKGRVYF